MISCCIIGLLMDGTPLAHDNLALSKLIAPDTPVHEYDVLKLASRQAANF
jgi:hypothetical protein